LLRGTVDGESERSEMGDDEGWLKDRKRWREGEWLRWRVGCGEDELERWWVVKVKLEDWR
jgi:hypothetical protein